MFTHNISALTPDFSQHGNTRAVTQYMGNKLTAVTYLKNQLRYFLVNEKAMGYFTSYLEKKELWLLHSCYL